MIRFVDLSSIYWTDPEESGGPCCAFLDVAGDRFVPEGNTAAESHIFWSLAEIRGCRWPYSVMTKPSADRYIERMLALVPPGFFSRHSDTPD